MSAALSLPVSDKAAPRHSSRSGKLRRVHSQTTNTSARQQMKIPFITLLLVFASLALADDFKMNNGKDYKNATVTQVDEDGIVVKTKTSISKLYFTELPEDVQKQYHYTPANAAAAQSAQV